MPLGGTEAEGTETSVIVFTDEETEFVEFFFVFIADFGGVDSANGESVVFAVGWMGGIAVLQEDLKGFDQF